MDLLSDPGIGRVVGVEERLPDLLPGHLELLEHDLTEEHGREVPLLGDVEHGAPPSPLGREAGDLTLQHVEATGGVPGHAVRVDHHEELQVEVLLLRDPLDIGHGA